MKKYLVLPGEVVSMNDRQTPFISAGALMSLYGVNPRECIVINKTPVFISYRSDYSGKIHQRTELLFDFSGLNISDYFILEPRYDGNYQVPKEKGNIKWGALCGR